jgi:hypothetical protein
MNCNYAIHVPDRKQSIYQMSITEIWLPAHTGVLNPAHNFEVAANISWFIMFAGRKIFPM